MLKYFAECKTAEELKKQYYQYVRQYHPDRPENGDAEQEILKAVNNEYEIAFNLLKNTHSNADGATYTKETSETPEQFKDIINKIVRMDGIIIEICGSWVWVSGNTRQNKDYFKEAGFRWSKNKTAWYWHSEPYRKYSKKAFSLDDIRGMFGSDKVDKEDAIKIEGGG